MSWGTWGRRLLLAGLAVVTGAYATRTYDRKVRQVGHTFRAGERTVRRGLFACDRCTARVSLEAGADVPECPSCGETLFKKID